MKRRLFPLFLGLLLALSACAPRPAPSEATPTPEPVPTESAVPAPSAAPEVTPVPTQVPAPVWGAQVSDCSRAAGDGTPLVEGEFTLPYIENAGGVAAYEAINDWYLDLSAGLRSDTLMNEALAADDYAVSQAMGDAFSAYSDEETYEIKYETPALVNILRTHYGYTGGTYPTLLYLSDRFDLTTGAPLSFEDFFTDPDQAQALILDDIVRQAAAGEHAAVLTEEALRASFRRDDFYLADCAIVFFYQPGILGPQAAEAPIFPISFSPLGELYVSHDRGAP